MVCKKDKAMEGTCFALKSLSKQAVVEGGQVQHIKDEKAVRVAHAGLQLWTFQTAKCYLNMNFVGSARHVVPRNTRRKTS